MRSVAAPARMTATATGKVIRDVRSAANVGASALIGCRERLQRPVAVRREAHVGEEARHDDALAEVAEPRFGVLAARDCERELRIAPSRREGQREPTAEARVDVRDVMRTVGLAEALDVR